MKEATRQRAAQVPNLNLGDKMLNRFEPLTKTQAKFEDGGHQ